jgi:hypothetical protein
VALVLGEHGTPWGCLSLLRSKALSEPSIPCHAFRCQSSLRTCMHHVRRRGNA